MQSTLCVCVCVCVIKREREREGDRDRERKREGKRVKMDIKQERGRVREMGKKDIKAGERVNGDGDRVAAVDVGDE